MVRDVGNYFFAQEDIDFLFPSKFNRETVGATVDVVGAIDWASMTTVAICCSSATDSVLCVCDIVACIGSGEWIPGILNFNFRLTHLIMLVVCSMDVILWLLLHVSWLCFPELLLP